MAAILYLETNFIVGRAHGQDPDSDRLISLAGPEFRLAIPSGCYMEALAWYERERSYRNTFREDMKDRIWQAQRDMSSEWAMRLVKFLRDSLIAFDEHYSDILVRLQDTLGRLFRVVESIEPTDLTVIDPTRSPLVDDPTDNLILHSILGHARTCPSFTKGFLSGDRKAFGQGQALAQAELRAAGIAYFTKTRDALSWASVLPPDLPP